MKFGKNLMRNEVPEWSAHYLNYKELKKLIKEAQKKSDNLSDKDLVPFFYALDRSIEQVDSFYNAKLAAYTRQLRHISDKHSHARIAELDPEELEDLISVLLDLRSQFRNLQWFAEVNKHGFVKILKKLDKRLGISAQTRYLQSRILILPFASGVALDEKLASVNAYLSDISPYAAEEPTATSSSEKILSELTANRNESYGGSSAASVTGNDMSEIRAAVLEDNVETLRLLTIGSTASSPPVAASSAAPPLNGSSLSTLGHSAPSAAMYSRARGGPSGPASQAATAGSSPLATTHNSSASLLVPSVVGPSGGSSDHTVRGLLYALARSVPAKSKKCMLFAIEHLDSIEDSSDVNGRNVLHRVVINHGRNVGSKSNSTPDQFRSYIRPAEIPRDTQTHREIGPDGGELHENPSSSKQEEENIFEFLLTSLKPSQRSSLLSRDDHGRTPLHYSAQYGLRSMTRCIVKYLTEWGLVPKSTPLDGYLWHDNEGYSPIHLAITGNHPRTTRAILDVFPSINDDSGLLIMAARLGSVALIQVLLEVGKLDINYRDEKTLETALYITAHLNSLEAVNYLITKGADLDIGEGVYGWTPVMIAAVDGDMEVVEALIKGGCDVEKEDFSGWNAKEHACLRGHLNISDYIENYINSKKASIFASLDDATKSSEKISPVTSGSSVVKAPIDEEASIKTFGHRYLDGTKSMLLVTLGSSDTRRSAMPVQLDRVPFSKAHSTQLDTALSLVVSASTSSDDPVVLDLPLSEGQNSDPLTILLDSDKNVKLYFDLVPTYSATRQVFGRAVALLPNELAASPLHLHSLNNQITLPILECETLEVLGTLKFEFMLVRPFKHPNMGIQKSSTYWRSLITTRVIGHRGLGKNFNTKGSLQLGENTTLSFIQAANLGASYVEFDVQLTKDFVPVIYHDFLVAETGIDIQMHQMTLEQFKGTGEMRHHGSKISSLPHNNRAPSPDGPKARGRSKSLFDSTENDDEFENMSDRMRYTRDYKIKGFKGNSRGISIQSPFVTLEEVFRTVPQHVGFNIECKYPMLDESEKEDMDGMAIELNQWVDTVLKFVYDNAKGRDIIFSSFSPDICIMLSLKQPSIPVLFLTEGGTQHMADVRASNLQEAIRFARRWNLLGIVSESTPLVQCPRLVQAVKESGLVCVTYGVKNNNPQISRMQMKSGVDAVIVDSVLAVRKGLTEEEANEATQAVRSAIAAGAGVHGEPASVPAAGVLKQAAK